MISFLSDRKCIDRLKKEYQEHQNLIIGYDFDNTVYDTHNQGLNVIPVIELLKKCSKAGFTMCLYTIPDRLHWKIAYVKELGIKLDYINESPIMPNTEKPYFNILLDDRAGLSASYNILKTTLKELNL